MIKIVPLILLVIGNILNAELSVERAAKIWIKQYDALSFDIEEKVYHPSELLDIIARHGHGLSDDIKTTFFTYVFSAAEQTLYVEIILFLIPSTAFISTNGTCLYAAA